MHGRWPMNIGATGEGPTCVLPLESLRRHALVLGSSGSGKTVLGKVITEECVAYRLPVIAIDLQGDVTALALDPDQRGAKFIERVEPKIWTPASKVGIPVSASRLDINELFGLWEGGPSSIGKARLSIISLVHLDDTERDRFIADLCSALHEWMLTLDGAQPWGLLYIDEVAPYLPPVRQPASKEPLMRLLRQARKYGLCCLLASQSPGDVDYKALGQVGSVLVGKLSTHQELRKIEPHLVAHGASRELLATLPKKRPGEFVVLSDGDAVEFRARQTYTPHRLVSQDEIRKLVTDHDRIELGGLHALKDAG
jgi:DNA helicase HerA-like ATPase